jgi:hypothetical protein
MRSIFGSKRDRYEAEALRLQEEGQRATGEAATLYGKAWAEAFTAGRHVMLDARNAQSASDARSRASYFSVKRQSVTAERYNERALEYDAIAQRHRAAAERCMEKAAELERDAEVAKAPPKAAAAPPQAPLRRPAPQPTPQPAPVGAE